MHSTKYFTGESENIFLDTGIIISLLLYKMNPQSAEHRFTHQLISYLTNNRTKNGKYRKFFISAITLTEIFSKIEGETSMQKVASVLKSPDIEIVAFDEQIAQELNSLMQPNLTNRKLNEFAQKMGFKGHELHVGREWILKDHIIIASAITTV